MKDSEFIMEELTELYPTRNYNRAISMPAAEALYPIMVQRFLGYINFFTNKITDDEERKIKNDLSEEVWLTSGRKKKRLVIT